MGTQLRFEFDHHELKIFDSVLQSVDQTDLIRELGQLFFKYHTDTKKEEVKDNGCNNLRKNHGKSSNS